MPRVNAGKLRGATLRAGKLTTFDGTIRSQPFLARNLAFTLQECDFCKYSMYEDTTCGPTVCTRAVDPTVYFARARANPAVLKRILENILVLQKGPGRKLPATVVSPPGQFTKIARGLRDAYGKLK